MSKSMNIKVASRDPTSVFATPEEVATYPNLIREQKIDILRLWEYDAAEAEVATEESMPGGDDELVRQNLLALDGLIGGTDVGDPGPTKQHVLLRHCGGRE